MSYRLPAEWEPHEATWLAWPTHPVDFEERPESAESNFVEFVRHLARSEPINLFVQNLKQLGHATAHLEEVRADLTHVRFFQTKTTRNWLRDSGAIYVHKDTEQRIALDFEFNAWGGAFDDFEADNEIAGGMAQVSGDAIATPDPNIVLEAGAVDTDGRGNLLTTQECLIGGSNERNIGYTRAEYENIFEEYFGIEKTLWLPWGLAHDETQGHIDNVARFVAPRTVVVASVSDKSSINYNRLTENLEFLNNYKDEQGAIEIIKLPLPQTIYLNDIPQAASYTNFYITNSEVLVPTYNDIADAEALTIIQRCFPNRTVRGIYCGDLLIGGGALHCLSQPLPARVTSRPVVSSDPGLSQK